MKRRAWPMFALVGVLLAQEPPRFRVETRVVQVPVTVTDAKGRNVDGLTARDFSILDDGAAREFALDTFGSGIASISLAIAIQTSGISTPAMAKVRRIGGMIQPLVIGRRGEAALVTFDDEVKWRQDFTSNPEEIQLAVKSLKSGSRMQARMFDAVIETARRMRDRRGRRVLMLISESRDRGSEAKLEEAIEAVEREGLEVFAASYSAYSTTLLARPEDLPSPSAPNYFTVFHELFRLAKTNHTQALAQATGGSEYPFLRERIIEKAIENLGVEVHSQYILSFPPNGARRGMHQIDVSVPGRTDLQVRSRRAYWTE